MTKETRARAINQNQTQPKGDFVKKWARGIFNVELIDGLSSGDNRDKTTTLTSTHDAGFDAGWHTQRALVDGQGYRVKRGQFESPVLDKGADLPVASLDIFDDGTAVYTERQKLLEDAVKPSILQEQTQTSQAVANPIPVQIYRLRVFTPKKAEEIGLGNVVNEDTDLEKAV